MSEPDHSEESRQIPVPDGLDAIAREAATFDEQGAIIDEPEGGEQPQNETPEATVSDVKEWRAAVRLGCGIVIAKNKGLEKEWTPEVLDDMAGALAVAGAHWGWNLQKIMGHPLIGLALAAWPMYEGAKRFAAEKAEAAPAQE